MNVQETRQTLLEMDTPTVKLGFYRIDADNKITTTVEALTEALKGLGKSRDFVVLPHTDKPLPVKPLRDWLKTCPAEYVTVTLVTDYQYDAVRNRYWETVTHDGLTIEYHEDGLKTRAFFAACGLDYNRRFQMGIIARFEFTLGLTVTPDPAPAKVLPCGLTRSELFTIYNRLKWAAKRAGNDKLTERLNKALGILQSNDYYQDESGHPRTSYIPTTASCGCKDWEYRFRVKRAYWGVCKHMLATWIVTLALDRRNDHDATGLVRVVYDDVEIRR